MHDGKNVSICAQTSHTVSLPAQYNVACSWFTSCVFTLSAEVLTLGYAIAEPNASSRHRRDMEVSWSKNNFLYTLYIFVLKCKLCVLDVWLVFFCKYVNKVIFC